MEDGASRYPGRSQVFLVRGMDHLSFLAHAPGGTRGCHATGVPCLGASAAALPTVDGAPLPPSQ